MREQSAMEPVALSRNHLKPWDQSLDIFMFIESMDALSIRETGINLCF